MQAAHGLQFTTLDEDSPSAIIDLLRAPVLEEQDDNVLVLQQRLVISGSAGVVGFSGGGLAVASPV
jgi:hypothetical protein